MVLSAVPGTCRMDQLDSIILRLHEAALRPDIWPEVMLDLSTAFDNRPLMYGVQWLPAGISFMQSVHMPDDIVQKIVSHYSSVTNNPVTQAAVPALKLHEPFPIAGLIDPTELEQTEYYKETIGQMDDIVGDFAVASHLAPTRMTVLVLARRSDQATASRTQLERLARLSPHLGLAMEVMVRMGRLDAIRTAFSYALCRVAQPIALLDSTGTVMFANPALEDLLAANRFIEIRAGRLHCSIRSENGAVQRFVSALIGDGADSEGERTLSINTGQSSQNIGLVGQPIHSDFARNLDLGGARAVLFISHLSSMRSDLAATFSMFYQLSDQQSEIVRLIVDGLDGPSIADRLSITQNTLKTHMNRIYEKTDTGSREELFRRLISLAAQTPIVKL
jgi:DNA-binding CsgD family transcriptional regulator